MAIIATCSCGERFDVPDRLAGQRRPCPRCGEPVELPVGSPVGLSTMKYLNRGSETAPGVPNPAEEAISQLPVCSDCQGSGMCHLCGGSSKGKYGNSSWEGVGSIIGVFMFGFGVWAVFWKDLFGGDNRAGSKVRCLQCSGSGRCYKCSGLGRVTA